MNEYDGPPKARRKHRNRPRLVRRLVAFGCAALTVTALAACSSSGGGGDDKGGSSASDDNLTLEQLYDKAVDAGQTEVDLYGTLNDNVSKVVFADFEKQFPKVKINWTDGTTEELYSKLVAEARGGSMKADVIQINTAVAIQVLDANLAMDWIPPEAKSLPPEARGTNYFASDEKVYVIAWNTDKYTGTITDYNQLTEPEFKGKLITDPTDFKIFLALGKHKFDGPDKAKQWLEGIEANGIKFFSGASTMSGMLAAGQAAVCMTCISLHFPPLKQKGAHVDFNHNEGVADYAMNVVLKQAPHPLAAKLFSRWVASADGQKAYADGGSVPASPNVPSADPSLRPSTIYPLTPDDVRDIKTYQDIWNSVFKLPS